MTVSIIIAMLSGLCFAVIGIAMRLGQNKDVSPLHISMCMGIGGAIYFGLQINWADWNAPSYVVITSLCAAAGMIAYMIFTKMCLTRGPLSPLWVATNLTFIVVTLYGAFMFRESITSTQGAALAVGVICVLFGANLGDKPKEDDSGKTPMKIKIEYTVLLLLVLICNSMSFIVIKELGTRLIPGTEKVYLSMFIPHMYFIMYTAIAIGSFIIVKFIDKSKVAACKWVLGLGGAAALASIFGMVLLSSVVNLPTAVVFTLNSIVCIVTGCIVSVLAFKEKAKGAWWATVGFGVLAVILANLR